MVKCLVKEGPGIGVRLTDRPLRKPDDEDIIVKPLAVGICGSDVESYLWRESRRAILLKAMPVVMGHEVLGVVTDGRGSRFAVGDIVISDPVISCGRCKWCRRGDSQVCIERRSVGYSVDGGLSESWVISTHCLVPIPKVLHGMAPEMLVLFEIFSTAVRASRRVPGGLAGRSCAVVGPGPLGVFLCDLLRDAGASEITVIGTQRSAIRFPMALKRGATEAVVADENWRQKNKDRFDVVFEVAGTVPGFMLALDIVDRGGTLVFASSIDEPLPILFNTQVKRREVCIIGSTAHSLRDWNAAFEIVQQGRVSLDEFIDAKFTFSQSEEAFRLAAERKFFKGVILMTDA